MEAARGKNSGRCTWDFAGECLVDAGGNLLVCRRGLRDPRTTAWILGTMTETVRGRLQWFSNRWGLRQAFR